MPASIYLDHNATTPVATEVAEAMAARHQEAAQWGKLFLGKGA
ncbi:MAG: hypothetical protein RI841_07955 [Halomonas sp.]|nr:hypothetical protein [Halomonas sp.]MDR9439412.1 hypothetical protein [Halomonas sp.]